ncbi:MAG: IS110 family transposase [Actinomycetota bacterium]
MITIGIDPHKSSHTAVALDEAGGVLGELRVSATRGTLTRLRGWAERWPERTWAVEGASGLGHLLAQQLVAAGEAVLDVPSSLPARARLLGGGIAWPRWPSATPTCDGSSPRTTAECCGCSPTAETSWPKSADGW